MASLDGFAVNDLVVNRTMMIPLECLKVQARHSFPKAVSIRIRFPKNGWLLTVCGVTTQVVPLFQVSRSKLVRSWFDHGSGGTRPSFTLVDCCWQSTLWLGGSSPLGGHRDRTALKRLASRSSWSYVPCGSRSISGQLYLTPYINAISSGPTCGSAVVDFSRTLFCAFIAYMYFYKYLLNTWLLVYIYIDI